MPEPIETPVEVFADAFIGVERKSLRITDAFEERNQRDRLGAHRADVLLVDQSPIQRPELPGEGADAGGIDGLFDAIDGCR